MGSLSWIHILLLAGVALVLFGGRGKVSDLMGDFGRGINSFKKGLNDPDKDPKVINSEPNQTASNTTTNNETVQR